MNTIKIYSTKSVVIQGRGISLLAGRTSASPKLCCTVEVKKHEGVFYLREWEKTHHISFFGSKFHINGDPYP